MLTTDTTRKDMLGCYGNLDMKTPYLDKLAYEGTWYENTYSCQLVCGVARSVLLEHFQIPMGWYLTVL